MSDPLYDVVLALHVLFALVGFGALAATGSYAHLARQSQDPFTSAALVRFFRPGHNLAARAIFLVPLAGATLLALGHGRDAAAPWPWMGLGLWVIAAGLASGMVWPTERELQRLLGAGSDPEGRLALLAARIERAGALCTILFIAALVVMIAQPT